MDLSASQGIVDASPMRSSGLAIEEESGTASPWDCEPHCANFQPKMTLKKACANFQPKMTLKEACDSAATPVRFQARILTWLMKQ